MANVFTSLVFLFALIFKSSNALMPFPNISTADHLATVISRLQPPNTRYCRSIITYMVTECLPYFMDDHSQPDDSCCFAFQSTIANDASCICDTIKSDNLSMDVTKTMKLPTICGVSLTCHYNALGSYPSEPVSGPSHAPNSPFPRPDNDSDDIIPFLLAVGAMIAMFYALMSDDEC